MTMGISTTPPGWPRDLDPPGSPEFESRVTGWLLDRGPAGLRGFAVLRRHPRALVLVVVDHCRATVEGLRESYAGARRELVDELAPRALDEVLAALESQGARAVETVREVSLVADALSGRKWTPRL